MIKSIWFIVNLLLAVVLISSSCTNNVNETSNAPLTDQTMESTSSSENSSTPSSLSTTDNDQSMPDTTPSTETQTTSTSTPTPTDTKTTSLPPFEVFMKGFNFGDWNPFDEPQKGLYRPPGTDQSMENLAAAGTKWISLVVRSGQETYSSTIISNNLPITATDSELLRVINLAQSLGMRVMLFPNLSLTDDPNHWWGEIGTSFTSEAQWQEWFASYRESINHYATFCQEAGVDMFCIGRELGGTTHRESDWRQVIQEVRQRFKGPITYSSLCSSSASVSFPHGEEKRIRWWDAVDYIGVSTYYCLTGKNDPSVEELKAAWVDKGYLALLENLSNQFNKPIILTELGYPSYDGANKQPGGMQKNALIDLQEQADCYQAALEVLWGKPWLKGIFWWQWLAETRTGGSNDSSGTPYGKPAEEILKRFYSLP